ncbi:MAG: ABC transporter ATP-binding protein [Tepidisphaeraceae bacterium]
MPEAFLQLRSISKRFGQTSALADVSLEVGADELLVVLGPTGAGKTTLLRTIAGLETPDAGSIMMAGQDVTRLEPAARDVALVFQNFSIYPGKTVRQNLEFPLKAPGRKMPREHIDERVTWAAKMLRIEPLLDRRSDRLSGGQMQRVAIGRAIVRRPRLFLMDEPLTNLDAKLREALRVELAMLRRELKTPMVYVTHDQAEAMSMADRVVVIGVGRVLQTGTPGEVYRSPASVEVARQVGQPTINLLPLHSGMGYQPINPSHPVHGLVAQATTETTLGIRPEHITIGTGAFTGTVVLVENAGPVLLIVIDWSGVHLRVITPRATSVEVGARVRFGIDAAQLIVFPPEARSALPR